MACKCFVLIKFKVRVVVYVPSISPFITFIGDRINEINEMFLKPFAPASFLEFCSLRWIKDFSINTQVIIQNRAF